MSTVCTLVESAVAHELRGLLSSAHSADAADALVAWVEDVAVSYGDLDALIPMLDECTRDLGALGDALRQAVRRSRRAFAAHADQPLDEIDARIDALFAKLEARDPLSSEHSRAVAAWCARLGRRLGLDTADVAFASRCGLLHDIGKSFTPLEVLNAPRALDEHEWRIMRAHAPAGEALVLRVAELRPFAPAVRSHHERLDGRGYPDGLRLGSIPLMARIVAVADCFNAMIGRRPYRLPLSPTRALEELTRSRGTQLDPEIVDAMVSVVLG